MPLDNIKLDLSFKSLFGRLSTDTRIAIPSETRFSDPPVFSNNLWADSDKIPLAKIPFNVGSVGFYVYNSSTGAFNPPIPSLTAPVSDLTIRYIHKFPLIDSPFGEVNANFTPLKVFRGFGDGAGDVDLRNLIPNSLVEGYGFLLSYFTHNNSLDVIPPALDVIVKDGYVFVFDDPGNRIRTTGLFISFFQYIGRFGLVGGNGAGSSSISVRNRTSLSVAELAATTVSNPIFRILVDSESGVGAGDNIGGVSLRSSGSNINFLFSYATAIKDGLLKATDWDIFNKKIGDSNLPPPSVLTPYVLAISTPADRTNLNITSLTYASSIVANSLVQRDAVGRFEAANPSIASHVTTKSYVDGLVSPGISQANVNIRVATTASVNLAAVTTIDTIPLLLNDRVLVKDNSPNQNGIYFFNGTGLTIDPNFDLPSELLINTIFFIEGGNVNRNTYYRVLKNLVGTDVSFILFSRLPEYIAGNGISINSNIISVNSNPVSFSFSSNILNLVNRSTSGSYSPLSSMTVDTYGIITSISDTTPSAFALTNNIPFYRDRVSPSLNPILGNSLTKVYSSTNNHGAVPTNENIFIEDVSFLKVSALTNTSRFFILSDANEIPGTDFTEHSTLHIRGSVSYLVTTVPVPSPSNLPYSINSTTENTCIYYFPNVPVDRVVNLPNPANVLGRTYKFCRGTGNGNLIISSPNGTSINGSQTFTLNHSYEMFEATAIANNLWIITSII